MQRLEGQALIAAHFVDLVIIAERQQILRIGGIVVIGVKVDEPLRRRARVFIVLVPMIGKRLHDQRAFGPFGIGIKPFNFSKVERGLIRLFALKLEFAPLVNLLGCVGL